MKGFQLSNNLSLLKNQGLYRQRLIIQSAQGVRPIIDGKQILSFCSNDYLGLANHPKIKQALIDGVNRWGVGSGSAHLVNGHSEAHHELELALAEFTGRDRALLFSTGYMANLAVVTALMSRHDQIYHDKLNHASLIDAVKLSGANSSRYRHLDYDQLQQLMLKNNSEHRQLVISDGVFSMDGDVADMNRIASICQENQAWYLVDDAHGFGVLGETGAGLLQQQGLNQLQTPILMATLGKAIGTSGAFVAGSEDLIETLIQSARPYIYTTAMPPALAVASLQSLNLVRQESWRREKLQLLIFELKKQLSSLDIELMPSDSPIQPLLIGDNKRALKISQHLCEVGILVTAIRPPTVAEGTARLRITLSTEHELDDINQLVLAIKKII